MYNVTRLKKKNKPMHRDQVLVRWKIPSGKSLHAQEFRDLLAKGGDGNALLPETLFHYRDGKPIDDQSKPPVRFVGGGGRWVGLLDECGDTGLPEMAMGVGTRVLMRHFEVPVQAQIEEIEYGVANEGLRIYHLRDMAIKTRTSSRRVADKATLIQSILLRDLTGIAVRHGFDLPPEAALDLTLHEHKTIGLRLGTASGITRECVDLVNATFSVNATLNGIWQVGSLQARGYGRIIPFVATRHDRSHFREGGLAA